MKQYSSREAAKKIGLHLGTLQRFIAENKIQAPPLLKIGAAKVRIWTDADIEKVRETLPKIANGRKTRHQKLRKKEAPAGASPPQYAKTARAGGPGAALPKKRGTKKKK